MKAYKKGFIDALTAYAHWKDGVEYVGTSGKTLKEAIEKVEETFSYCLIDDPLPDTIQEALNSGESRDMENKWISIKDRLPKKDGRYLAWAKGWFAPQIVHYTTTIEEDKIVYWWHNEDVCYEPADYPMIEEDGEILPTHWMSLTIPKLLK